MSEKNTGVVRRIDDLGRIVIPKEIRRSLNLMGDNASVEIHLDRGCIVLSPIGNACILCGEKNDEKLVCVGEDVVCTGCLDRFEAARNSQPEA